MSSTHRWRWSLSSDWGQELSSSDQALFQSHSSQSVSCDPSCHWRTLRCQTPVRHSMDICRPWWLDTTSPAGNCSVQTVAGPGDHNSSSLRNPMLRPPNRLKHRASRLGTVWSAICDWTCVLAESPMLALYFLTTWAAASSKSHLLFKVSLSRFDFRQPGISLFAFLVVDDLFHVSLYSQWVSCMPPPVSWVAQDYFFPPDSRIMLKMN